MPAVYALYIVNKSGGLIYDKDFVPTARLDVNDKLRIASMWHSLHAIASQLSPIPGCTGIQVLEAETFNLHCYQTPTSTKFLVMVEPASPNVEKLLQTVYEYYADYVLKNPFYEVEMPIRCELFDTNVLSIVAAFTSS
mmetsp:Transcript_40328/g.114172  ORF Transcript_40328/g.114172 Transcript_40328/m.114172 type:complete len:138 (-) Transcript_40328:791-1204(-)|eukprot:CAMPEP_0117672198 /NCGR_PEP_ID=MMETSP0804-20121206/13767_1 /TAXON_ID=1074897 /ORGANISM="Tetraselmis astigmatica, Strain CCMP880" /LENGTH=137 /DNA_ID=CAMNT_0005480765 /DNA_START=313 /DNA_END=726 /DNA_ORIENTATION=-